ncbi:WXG100 family type VII secretion target [Bacillus thuringiensis]|uniref:WXG100 family type VII secretion target n=1 Tax=Bacillus thuringiensis TaxID=1428 RepID=UPI000BF950F8|nr:WXG100 family type VII secretion target [Bacillus thuringiensis]PER48297.1 hypothetical protein CN486_30175 [Bacillus thuringiensis]
MHKDLYNQTEYIASMWNGATSQRFYQMFNETKPQMFNVFREFDKIAEELMHAAEKFRNADELYDGNLVDGSLSNEKIEAGAMGDKPPEKSMLRKIWDGIYVGSGQVIGEIVEGFDSLDDTVAKENVKYAIGHPIETVSTAWNTVSDSFMNDFWHGDAESRTKWGTSIFMGLGLGWVGDKGISRVGKVTTLGIKAEQSISHFSNKLKMRDPFAYVGDFRDVPKTSFNSLEEARNTFMFADPGNLNTPRFQEYLSQVEEITNRKIPEKQRELLQEHIENNSYERLSKEEVAKRRSEFGRLKDDLREEWELETNQKWPTYEEEILSRRGIPLRHVDDPYDAHHFIENAHGGEHEWWNIHPAKFPTEHQGGIHGKEGISKEIFKKK